MAEPVREPLDFVFLWWTGEDHGVVLSRGYYTLVERFHRARHTATTWGEFLGMLGDSADYIEDFMQTDEAAPEEGDRLDSLSIWVLDNCEFPLTQCAQETYQFYGVSFPDCDDAVMFRTEYGMPVRLFPKSAYLAVKHHLAQSGHRLSDEMAWFPMHIYDY